MCNDNNNGQIMQAYLFRSLSIDVSEGSKQQEGGAIYLKGKGVNNLGIQSIHWNVRQSLAWEKCQDIFYYQLGCRPAY